MASGRENGPTWRTGGDWSGLGGSEESGEPLEGRAGRLPLVPGKPGLGFGGQTKELAGSSFAETFPGS